MKTNGMRIEIHELCIETLQVIICVDCRDA